MRAKFYCFSIERFSDSETAQLSAVADDGTPENESFNEATPSGELGIHIDNPNAFGFFKPGKNYYLDFSKAPE